nr:MAG TPA: hypothetical protein [Caudoviricetes sp.]
MKFQNPVPQVSVCASQCANSHTQVTDVFFLSFQVLLQQFDL